MLWKAQGIKEFVDVLFNKKIITHRMKRIQSKLHRTETYVCKIYLYSFDDKKHILDDGIKSLAHFHKDKRSQKNWVKLVESMESIESVDTAQKLKFFGGDYAQQHADNLTLSWSF